MKTMTETLTHTHADPKLNDIPLILRVRLKRRMDISLTSYAARWQARAAPIAFPCCRLMRNKKMQ